MRKLIAVLRVFLPGARHWRSVAMVVGGVAAIVAAFYCGRWLAPAQATANDSHAHLSSTHSAAAWNPLPSDPGKPVAYIYGNIPVSRQELGEYLIARLGAQRLDFMVNRKIIELECQKRGITVTDQEVDAQLIKDLEAMNIPSISAFVNTVLKRFKKTLYEYKEDAIRPKLALRKLCRNRVRVTLKDIQDAFEAKYGPKVQCRLIVFPKGTSLTHVEKVWNEVRQSEEAFSRYAREHNIPPLKSKGGVVPPIHKHFPDKDVEREAFSLRPGEVSKIITLPDGSRVILKCDRHIPAVTDRRLADEELKLRQEVFEQKLLQEIPKYFQELRAQAKPKLLLQRDDRDPNTQRRLDRMLTESMGSKFKAGPAGVPGIGLPPSPPPLDSQPSLPKEEPPATRPPSADFLGLPSRRSSEDASGTTGGNDDSPPPPLESIPVPPVPGKKDSGK